MFFCRLLRLGGVLDSSLDQRLWRSKRVVADTCDENVDWSGVAERAGAYFKKAAENGFFRYLRMKIFTAKEAIQN